LTGAARDSVANSGYAPCPTQMDPFCATFAIMPDYRCAAPNGGSGRNVRLG
jgi:hypothetical protein